jgi:hypothetical protein
MSACCVCEAYRATETLPASIVRNDNQVKITIFLQIIKKFSSSIEKSNRTSFAYGDKKLKEQSGVQTHSFSKYQLF